MSPLSMELTDYPGLDALRLREMDPTSLPFLCTMARASTQRRCRMSLPMSYVRSLLRKAGHHRAPGCFVGYPKFAAQAEDQRDVQRKS